MNLATKSIWTDADLQEVNRRINRWTEDADGPIRFVKEALDMDPTPQQCDLLRAVANFESGGKKIGISVRSGQGCGKTSAAAMTILWFLVGFENSLAHCTAPTETQISTVLWGELNRLIVKSRFLSQILDWKATRILVRGAPITWAAVAHTARNVEAMQGKHRDHMLVVCDECSGIEDRFLDALTGGLTEHHNLALWISNPTVGYGRFYESHTKSKESWTTLHFNARHSPLVNSAHIQRMEQQYGRESPIIKIRIDGEFPDQSEVSLVNRKWLDDFQVRQPFPEEDSNWELGVDVARYGSAFTAIAVRHGRNLKVVRKWHGASLDETTGRVIDLVRQYPKIKQIKVDAIGVGAGVVDMLFAQQEGGALPMDVEIIGVNVAETSDSPTDYPRLRDQLWFEMADRLRDGEIAPDLLEGDTYDKQEILNHFCSEILPIEYRFTISGQRKVDSKDDMVDKLGRSPDVSDAVLLAFREEYAGIIGFVNLLR